MSKPIFTTSSPMQQPLKPGARVGVNGDPSEIRPLNPLGKFECGTIAFSSFGDRVLIQEDDFKSGYECESCGGSGKSQFNPNARCKDCEGKGAILVIPEVSERRPTTGTIVSVGEDVKQLKVGQSVLYSSYAGHTIDLNRAGRPVVLRILHEPEILCLVEGHLDLRQVRGKSEIAFAN